MTALASLRPGLVAGAESLGVALSAAQTDALLQFAALMCKWNRTYNLTAIRRDEEVLTHHLLDALSLLPHLGEPASVVDLGSGAGLPGLVIAIMRPRITVWSVDKVAKKIAFQQQVRIELGLDNFVPYCERLEALTLPQLAECLCARAFASLAQIAATSAHLLVPGGRVLAMKGVYPQDELDELDARCWRATVCRIRVPSLSAERHLVTMERI